MPELDMIVLGDNFVGKQTLINQFPCKGKINQTVRATDCMAKVVIKLPPQKNEPDLPEYVGIKVYK